MGELIIDESRLPVVVVTYPKTLRFEDFERLFERYALLSLRHPRLAYLLDMSQLDVLGWAGDFRRMGAVFARHREVLTRVTLCEARVAPGVVLRNGLDVFDSLAVQKWPRANFATHVEAETWVARHLAQAGLRAGR